MSKHDEDRDKVVNALGGKKGLIDSGVPAVVFLVVFNFTKELTDSVLTMCKKYCRNFVVRSFKRKLENMKIADYFPKENDFHIMPDLIDEYDDYNFFCWSFYE